MRRALAFPRALVEEQVEEDVEEEKVARAVEAEAGAEAVKEAAARTAIILAGTLMAFSITGRALQDFTAIAFKAVEEVDMAVMAGEGAMVDTVVEGAALLRSS